MKLFAVFLALLLVCGVAFAAGEFEVTLGEKDPGTHQWRPSDSNSYDVFAQWKLKNTTTREIQIDKITIGSDGTGNETGLEVVAYSDNDADGFVDTPGDTYRGWGQFNADNGTTTITMGNNLAVASGSTVYLLLNVHPIGALNAGDTFKTSFAKIEGHYTVNSVAISQSLTGAAYSGGTVTIWKTYYVELLAGTGNASWVATNNSISSGKAMLNGEVQEFDFTLKVFKACGEWLSSTGEQGGQYTVLMSSPVQYFASDSENFSSASVLLRSSSGPGNDTVTMRIHRDAPDGTVIKQGTLSLSLVQIPAWYSYDFSKCAAVCGNGHVESGEECDGASLNGKACTSFAGLYNGSLSCGADCKLIMTDCLTAEQKLTQGCLAASLQGKTYECSSLNEDLGTAYQSGSITFGADCSVSLGNCSNEAPGAQPPAGPTCGNNVLEGNEACDSMQLNGKTCATFGFDSGTLVCTNQCIFDIANCAYIPEQGTPAAVCGNGIRESGERCDGADMGGYTCLGLGYDSGTSTCDSSCNPNLGACKKTAAADTGTTGPSCGNGTMESGEACDKADMGGKTCASMGWGSGTLKCSSYCTLDRISCIMGNPPQLGAGNADAQQATDQNTASILAGFDQTAIACAAAAIIVIAIIASWAFFAKSRAKAAKRK